MKSYSNFRNYLINKSLFEPKSDIASAISEIGFLQADPIRSPARAQDLILRHRVKGYKAGDLEKYYPNLPLEEAYLFAYGFIPEQDWNLIYPEKKIKLSDQNQRMLDFIGGTGNVDSKILQNEFGTKKVKNPWGGTSQQAKQILEHLHAHGYLRVSGRRKGIRLYSISKPFENKLSPEERYKRILLKLVTVMGPTNPTFLFSETTHFSYLYKTNETRKKYFSDLKDEGKLIQTEIDGNIFVDLSTNIEEAESTSKKQLFILAPFDPIVRDRKRFEQLWNWNYRFEAYTPKSKRKLGYYALPLLWKDDIIGWVNASFQNNTLYCEIGFSKEVRKTKTFQHALEKELSEFSEFLNLETNDWELKYLN